MRHYVIYKWSHDLCYAFKRYNELQAALILKINLHNFLGSSHLFYNTLFCICEIACKKWLTHNIYVIRCPFSFLFQKFSLCAFSQEKTNMNMEKKPKKPSRDCRVAPHTINDIILNKNKQKHVNRLLFTSF